MMDVSVLYVCTVVPHADVNHADRHVVTSGAVVVASATQLHCIYNNWFLGLQILVVTRWNQTKTRREACVVSQLSKNWERGKEYISLV